MNVMDRRTSKRPIFICYICNRAFGSKSIAIHETQCLEHWKRENELLPPNQRTPLPQKPDNARSVSQKEFSDSLQNSIQSTVFPSQNFETQVIRESSVVHQTMFKERSNNHKEHVLSTEPRLPMMPFNQPKIPIMPINAEDIQLVRQEGSRVTAARIPLGTCYICGKLFGAKSIYHHEPECLKRWRVENDKLPPHSKRLEPVKPALVLNADGTIDLDTMAEAGWQRHLQELVPCRFCHRTFHPERLMIHERNCKGD